MTKAFPSSISVPVTASAVVEEKITVTPGIYIYIYIHLIQIHIYVYIYIHIYYKYIYICIYIYIYIYITYQNIDINNTYIQVLERKIKKMEVRRKENSMEMVDHRKKTKSRFFVNTSLNFFQSSDRQISNFFDNYMIFVILT
jgi:hypothetical protein